MKPCSEQLRESSRQGANHRVGKQRVSVRVLCRTWRVQGREADFERYYQGLFATYSRFPALKDELRKGVEGPTYRRKG
jgi:hypothetical protein